jgi:hypothetical protein
MVRVGHGPRRSEDHRSRANRQLAEAGTEQFGRRRLMQRAGSGTLVGPPIKSNFDF